MSNDESFKVKVVGMTCQHCVSAVDKSVRAVPGVTDVVVDLESGAVSVSGNFDPVRVKEAIKAAGYEPL